jgi:hypothetical protein
VQLCLPNLSTFVASGRMGTLPLASCRGRDPVQSNFVVRFIDAFPKARQALSSACLHCATISGCQQKHDVICCSLKPLGMQKLQGPRMMDDGSRQHTIHMVLWIYVRIPAWAAFSWCGLYSYPHALRLGHCCIDRLAVNFQMFLACW